MVGITDSLRIAVSGLQLAQDSLATTSNNVANVNTEGYTRKRVEQEARVIAGRGAGVGEVAISRDVDQFLERQVRIQQGKFGKSQTVNAYADDVQGLVFGNPSENATGLASFVDDLATKLEAAAAKPEDGARRSALVWSAQDVFGELERGADQVQLLRRDADQRIAALVEEVNTALQSIDDLNTDIVRSPEDAALLDQRDRLVKELSYKLDVHTYVHDDNRIAIFSENGQALLEYEPRVLDFGPASQMNRAAAMNPITIYAEDQIDPASGRPFAGATGEVMVGGGLRANASDPADAIRPTVTGGELGGLLEVRDRLLPELDDQLTELGGMLRHRLNAAHNGANVAGAPPSQLIGRREDLAPDVPVSAAPEDATVGGTAHVVAYDPNDPSGNHRVIDVDLSAVQTTAEGLVPSPPGTPATDWPQHFAQALADEINAAAGGDATATAGTTFELQANGGWRLAVAEGDGFVKQADDGGRTRAYGLSHFLGFNDFVTADGGDASRLGVRSDIVADPQRITNAKLEVPGPDGEPFALGGVGDGRGLGDLAAALDQRMPTIGRGGLPDATVSAREYLGDVVSMQAMQAATAERAAKNDSVLAEELDFQKAGISGVNLDEEMAHLLELQQAYSTSARLLTTADEMLQTLLNAKR